MGIMVYSYYGQCRIHIINRTSTKKYEHESCNKDKYNIFNITSHVCEYPRTS